MLQDTSTVMSERSTSYSPISLAILIYVPLPHLLSTKYQHIQYEDKRERHGKRMMERSKRRRTKTVMNFW